MRLVAVACAAALVAAPAVPAQAVDRTLGADVPRPSASGEPWSDADLAALDANVDVTLAGAATLRGAHVALYAVDARDGRVLYERNQDDRVAPESTLKLLTGSVALEKLGPARRFETAAFGQGLPAAGVLGGNLIVRARGDPYLGVADFAGLAAALRADGIRQIAGDVVFDVSRYDDARYPDGWLVDDLPYGYAAPVSALAFEHNAVHVTVTPGSVVDGPANVTTAPLDVLLPGAAACPFATLPRVLAAVTTVASNAPDTLAFTRDRFNCTHLDGAIPFGADAEILDAAVPDPSSYAAQALRAELARHGITVMRAAVVAPSAPEIPALLWSHESEPLSDVLADCWLPSDNLAAEMLVRELAAAAGAAPATTAAGIAVENTWLAGLGVDPAASVIEDGSGLSSYDRLTARTLVTILQHDFAGPNHDLIVDDLPLAGVRGTLKDAYVGTPLEKRVFAKTGSASHASALAGYAATKRRGTVIFAFMVDDWAGDPAALRDLRARVLAHFIQD